MKKSLAGVLVAVFLCSLWAANAYPQEEEEEERPREELKARITTITKTGGILLRQGEFEIEPSYTYGYFSADELSISGFAILPVIVVGEIELLELQRNIFIPALTLRVGLTDFVQAEFKAPIRYHYEIRTMTEQAEETKEDFHVADVEAAVFWHFLSEAGRRPDMILGARLNFPTGESPFGLEEDEVATGSGYYGLKTSLTLVKSVDPAIIYGNVAYFINFARTQVGLDTNPGDSIEYAIGSAMALSPSLSANVTFEQRLTMRTKITLPDLGSIEVPGSFLNQTSIRIGLGYRFTDQLYLDFGISGGLSEDAPDVLVSLSFPYRF